MRKRENELQKYYSGTVKNHLLTEVRKSGNDFLDKILDKDYQENHLYRHPLFKFLTQNFDFIFDESMDSKIKKLRHKIIFEALINCAEKLKKELS